jgi:hypothetical protein
MTKDSPVPLALHKNKLMSITSKMIADLIQDGIVAIGKTKLIILQYTKLKHIQFDPG